MLWVDIKFVQLLSPRLRNFKRKSEYLWNFSCCLCGDSKRHPRKARGYVYKKGDRLNYSCKRCGAGMTLKNLVRAVDPELHREMQLEYIAPADRLSVYKKKEAVKEERPQQSDVDPFSGLIPISKLPEDHFCRQYVEGRHIPKFLHDDLYYTPIFYTWCGNVLPGRYKVPKTPIDDEPRLVIPFRNAQGEVTAFQGRQLKGEDTGQKYVYLVLNKDEPVIWGLNNIDTNQPIYAFEGPIDAMFVPNAIACGGGDIAAELLKLAIPKDKFVIVYDNEPRKPATIDKIKKAILRGFAVCIWPKMDEKDVNDMVKRNIKFGLAESCQYVFTKIQEGTYSGPSATLALTHWDRTKK